MKVNIQAFGLSDKNRTTTIFTEITKRGHSSLLPSAIPENGRVQREIQSVDTKVYFKNLMVFPSFVIKRETQGVYAIILSRIPDSVWENTIRAEIKVWALASINLKEVDALLSKLGKFDLRSWCPTEIQQVEIEDIRAFWFGKSGTWRNLFLSKSI